MRTYIIKRLLEMIPTILMITLVVFVMMRSIPGDPVVAMLGDAYTEEDAERVRQEYGLNRPVIVQYVIWLGKLVRGDWGTSILSGRPVLQDVMARLPVTMELIVLSMAVALAIAIPYGRTPSTRSRGISGSATLRDSNPSPGSRIRISAAQWPRPRRCRRGSRSRIPRSPAGRGRGTACRSRG